MVPLCLDQGIGLIPWSPLARGFLAGNRTRTTRDPTPRARDDSYADRLYYEEADFKVLDTLIEVSARLGEKPAKVALAWLLSVPGVGFGDRGHYPHPTDGGACRCRGPDAR